MKTSLIITTYNWKEALELVLRSVARQVKMPDEIVIADDGSRPDTAELINTWAAKLPVPIKHIWQEDLGFRAARSRNRAIAAASGGYLIFIDGDMVLNKHFIADHILAAKPGYFIQGVRLFTTASVTQQMLTKGIIDLHFFTPDIERRRHTIRNRMLSWMLYQQVHNDQNGIRSCNQAYWKRDLLQVNGFNEQMVGWGFEDHDLAARLYHSDINRRNLKFAGLATHLYHHSRSPEGENPNEKIFQETLHSKTQRCMLGIDQHLQ